MTKRTSRVIVGLAAIAAATFTINYLAYIFGTL